MFCFDVNIGKRKITFAVWILKFCNSSLSKHLWLNRAGHVINSQETCLKHDPNIDALQSMFHTALDTEKLKSLTHCQVSEIH